MDNPQGKVEFTQRQLEWLDKQYPEVAATAQTTEREMVWGLARRSVVRELRERLTKQR